jgi:hypothetical protein
MSNQTRDTIIDDVLANLIDKVRNNTLDTAAKIAALYGASAEVVEHILMLKEVPKS